ncbi:MAG: relaxase domain-containing protein [Terriglobia bacterium]
MPTWDPGSQRWLALQTHDIFKAIRYCGKVYQNELARQYRNLGYEIEMIRKSKGLVEGFEIKGVSEELRLRFSKRRAEVEAAIDWKQTSNKFQLCFHFSFEVTARVETERKRSGYTFQLPSARSTWEEIS